MKNTTLFKGALAFAAASLFGASVHAQNYVNYANSDGDLVLNFRATASPGNTFDLEVDLGNFQSFMPGGAYATGAPVSMNSFFSTADLSATTDTDGNGSQDAGFGSLWNSDSKVLWSVVGNTTNPGEDGLAVDTIFGTLGTSVAPTGTASGDQSNVVNFISNEVNGLNAYIATDNSQYAAFAPTSDTLSYNSQSGASAPFFGYSPFQANFETSANGTSTANLYAIQPSTTGEDLGTFTLNSGGLTFQSEAAVPEPSTWATVVLGAAALIGLRYRRRVA